MDQKEEPQIPQPIVGAMSIQSRLLPFWREIPRAWFIQFEAVIDPLKTSDEQKWRYVLQQLQAQDLQHITDILYHPPEKDKYETLKKRLLAAYDKSDVRNFQQLISGLELGDQKPSQLLRKMRELGTGMITEDGLRIEWLNHMPAQVRVVLSINSESSLDTLAAMADKMVEYTGPATVAAVSISAPPSTSTATTATTTHYDVLALEVEKLKLEVAELRGRSARRHHYRHHPRSRSRQQSRPRRKATPTPGREDSWECRYHYKFGDKARHCESPCRRRTRPTASLN